MMNVNKYHIYFWVSFFAFFMLLDYIQYREYFNLARQLYMPLVDLSTFYSFLFAMVKFKKKSTGDLVISISRFFLSFSLIVLLNYFRFKLAEYYGKNPLASFGTLLNDTIYIYTSTAFYSLGYYYLNRYNTKQKELRQLAEQQAFNELAKAQLVASNAQLRQDLLEVENNFLRAQVNPHFLYNTLNLFYARILPVNKDLANGVLTLADIMRYSLEATESSQLVPLQMEVAQLRRVIDIHQLRFGNRLNITFAAEGEYQVVSVVPLIFITLLENALKHGELNDPDNPVRVRLFADDTRIYFTIQNKKSTDPPEHSHGIGLDNIKKRLNNVYGKHYNFVIEETAKHYHVTLTIEHNAGSNN